MANAIYPKYKQACISGGANTNLSAGTVKVMVIDTADEVYNAADEFLSDITGAGIVATSPALTTKTVTNGVFDADDPTITGVTGDQAEALIFFVDTGVAGTSRLIAFLDTGWTGLPVTPNGSDITLQFNASGIFAL